MSTNTIKMCANCFYRDTIGLAGYYACRGCSEHSKWKPLTEEQQEQDRQRKMKRSKTEVIQ